MMLPLPGDPDPLPTAVVAMCALASACLLFAVLAWVAVWWQTW